MNLVNRRQKKVFFRIKTILLLLLALPFISYAEQSSPVVFSDNGNCFIFAKKGKMPPLILDENEFEGVKLISQYFVDDFGRLGFTKPEIKIGKIPKRKNIILIGTIGKCSFLDKLETSGKIDLSAIKGKWEATLTQVVENPFPDIDKALVIAGSDKRGTIYGMFNLSREMGVSPWYWWADVPTKQEEAIYIKQGRFITNSPKVKYRGIFLNDEEPALGSWVREKFGDFNHNFYKHVFELILRLRGNFMWPAMWGKAFYDDDPENGELANKMGIVMGTSHHEPLGRAHVEWRRHTPAVWNYTKSKKELLAFWTHGMERMKNYETIVTVGMRGDGDKAMSKGTNIALLEKIVKAQRKIISKVTGQVPEKTPQVWALYKEVQDYYDKGMRVPDDVTLMLCDDNWGNVRKLPDITQPLHPGGYGMYYHIDYVGGPRNYKWINVSPIQQIWTQMSLTYSHGVDRIWILNVGDLKPMEYPVSFFLDMAWNPEQFTPDNLLQHTENWSTEQFGEKYAKEAARIINLYTKYNHRITPELLNDTTFSLKNYNEFERVRNDYRNLALDALRLYNLIPDKYKDAFDELVLFPANACSNLYEMYYAVAKNHQLARTNNIAANKWASVVEKCFKRDSLLTIHYNQQIANGKWNHMMDQIRIGYSYWQQPEKAKMPKVFYVKRNKTPNSKKAFEEADGYVSILAEDYQEAYNSKEIYWKVIPDLGKTGSAVTTFPQNKYPIENDTIALRYAIKFTSKGEFDVHVLVSPTLNFNQNKGLRYAISFDNEAEQVVNINHKYTGKEMEHWQANRINETITKHTIQKTGLHHLQIRVLEPGIVLQKIIIDTGNLQPSYLGPEESKLTEEKD